MKIKIPLRLVEPEDDSYHLAAASVFEDGTTGFWIVDTGASKSVFDKNLKDYFIASSEKKTRYIPPVSYTHLSILPMHLQSAFSCRQEFYRQTLSVVFQFGKSCLLYTSLGFVAE